MQSWGVTVVSAEEHSQRVVIWLENCRGAREEWGVSAGLGHWNMQIPCPLAGMDKWNQI